MLFDGLLSSMVCLSLFIGSGGIEVVSARHLKIKFTPFFSFWRDNEKFDS